MLLLVLNALLPLASPAIAASGGPGDAAEICSSTGMVRIPTGESEGSGNSDAGPMQDCLFCRLLGDQAWLPASPIALPRLQPQADRPAACDQASSRSVVWLSARSRAPPSLLN